MRFSTVNHTGKGAKNKRLKYYCICVDFIEKNWKFKKKKWKKNVGEEKKLLTKI